MTPWIQVYTNTMTHRKTCKLRDILGLKTNYEAVGVVVCFWSWAAVNAVNGDITGYSSRDIADAVGYKKAPSKLLGALVESGFVDRNTDGSTKIHDWEEHAALLMDSNEQQKKNTRERVKRYRERRKQKSDGECNGSESVTCNDCVTVTHGDCNGPTLPNLTLPNLTINISGDDGDNARAKAASEKELGMIGLKPGEFCGVTSDHVARIKQITWNLFSNYSSRRCINADCRRVFEYITRNDMRTNTQVISEDALGLLRYAFETAHNAGNAGNWNYIDGVMSRLSSRDIETEDQAREWDENRPDKET